MDKFVEDWNIIQTLGEGAYGEVKLLVHQRSGDAVAMKVVDLRKWKDARACVLREEQIHKRMHHPNIIRFLGRREEPDAVYIFLEYAAGGELFNRIEPDVGMPQDDVRSYMRQLLDGLDYLHQRGVAHRDIKPENLLIDERNVLKICDFGLATVFRLRGKERQLDKRCGTLPYVAPEVLEKPYNAVPADLWSCGIVYVAMLAGELPWDEPRESNKEYEEWANGGAFITRTPWSKLAMDALSLTRKILAPDPTVRPTLRQILEHPWMTRRTDDGDETDEPASKRPHAEGGRVEPTVTVSQPVQKSVYTPGHVAALWQNRQQNVCFSQPTQNENMFLNSQLQSTQSPLTYNNFEKLIKRMTRFFVKTSYEKAIANLFKTLDSLAYSWNSDPTGVVTVSTVDSRKMPLEFKANVIDMDGKLLLDFRLSRGCGIEFKRRFLKIRHALTDIVQN